MNIKRPNVTPPLACVILLVSTLVIQTFSNSLSFYDGLAEGGFIKTILDKIYTYRDICLFLSVCILLFYRALPKDSVLLVLSSVCTVLMTFTIRPENIPYFKVVQTIFILCINVYILKSATVFIE